MKCIKYSEHFSFFYKVNSHLSKLLKKKILGFLNYAELKRYCSSIGENNVINGRIRIYGYGRLNIGSYTTINSSFDSNPIGGQDRTSICAYYPQSIITIGNHCGISNSSLFAMNRIVIEDYVIIGGNCKVYDTDFHSIHFNSRMGGADLDICTKPVLIKIGAFIGGHSIILKGVTIGKHSIIGAGSVVTTNIPDGEMWAGNPAHFIRKIEKDGYISTK